MNDYLSIYYLLQPHRHYSSCRLIDLFLIFLPCFALYYCRKITIYNTESGIKTGNQEEIPAVRHCRPGAVPVAHPQLPEGCQVRPHRGRRHQQGFTQQC